MICISAYAEMQDKFSDNAGQPLLFMIEDCIYIEPRRIKPEVLLSCTSYSDFAACFGMNLYDFYLLVKNKPYRKFSIPKKSGGMRLIHAPMQPLKSYLKTMNNVIQDLSQDKIPSCVHGFIKCKKGEKSKSIITNALPHTCKNYILNADIKDFFSSIHSKNLINELSFVLGDKHRGLAAAIVALCCHDNCLPAGSPASPVLSNLYCMRMDNEIWMLCQFYGITYTRYADDMTFSSNQKFEDIFVHQLQMILRKYDFVINSKKLRITNHNRSQSVTGLIVNKKVNVNRIYKKKLRAILHNISVNGFEAAACKHYGVNKLNEVEIRKFSNKVSGMVSFVNQVKNINKPN